MKKQYFLLVFFLCCEILSGQSTNLFFSEETAVPASIVQTKSGDYLVASNISYFITPSFVSLYSEDGQTLLHRQIEATDDRLIYSAELDNGNLIHIFQRGEIYQSNASGENFVLLHNVSLPLAEQSISIRVIPHNQALHIITIVRIDDTSENRAIDFVLDLENPNEPLQQYNLKSPSTRSIAFLDNGSSIACSFDGDLTMLDANGALIWHITDIPASFREVKIDRFGNIYAIGNGEHGGFIIKLDTLGNILWQLEDPVIDCPASVCFYNLSRLGFSEDGTIIVTGEKGYQGSWPISEVVIMEIDKDGHVLWKEEKNISLYWNFPIDILKTGQGKYLITGNADISDAIGSERTFFIELDLLTSTEKIYTNARAFNLYPNPTGDYLYIDEQTIVMPNTTVEIFDLLGNHLRSFHDLEQLYVGDLAAATYILRINSKTGSVSMKWGKL